MSRAKARTNADRDGEAEEAEGERKGLRAGPRKIACGKCILEVDCYF